MIQGRWMPQTEEEWQLLEDLHIVTRMANQEGVSKARISSVLAFMASAAAQQSAFEESSQKQAQSLSEKMDTDSQPIDVTRCPECDEIVDHLAGGMGEPACPECGSKVPPDIVEAVMYD